MRKIYIDGLKKYRGSNIDWRSSVGQYIRFEYDDINGAFFIKRYNIDTKIIVIEYRDMEYEISTDSLKNGRISRILNDIRFVNKELSDCIIDDEDIKFLSKGSEKKIKFKCPRCGNIQKATVKDTFRRGLSCKKCGDGISFPEKFIYNFLEQTGVNFECQKVICNYRYDFYIPSLNLVIEADGLQHYDTKSNWYRNDIDSQKDILLKELGIKCVHINCSISDTDYIKNNILASDLSNIFDINIVDFEKCAIEQSNVLIAAKMYNQQLSIEDIADKLRVHRATALRYLKKANKCGVCNFDIGELKQQAKEKRAEMTSLKCSKGIVAINKFGERFEFRSISDLEKKSEDVLGVHIFASHACQCANKKYGRKSSNGFTFEYT